MTKSAPSASISEVNFNNPAFFTYNFWHTQNKTGSTGPESCMKCPESMSQSRMGQRRCIRCGPNTVKVSTTPNLLRSSAPEIYCGVPHGAYPCYLSATLRLWQLSVALRSFQNIENLNQFKNAADSKSLIVFIHGIFSLMRHVMLQNVYGQARCTCAPGFHQVCLTIYHASETPIHQSMCKSNDEPWSIIALHWNAIE